MTKKHVTHDEAMDAMCDPDVPLPDALVLFKRAFRRSNGATKAFVLHVAGICRSTKQRQQQETTT